MDINELIQALADPKVQDAVNAIIKSHKSDAAESEAAAAAPAAEMEAAAGVTDEDKKPEDEKAPAMLRAQVRIARATARYAKAHTDSHTALLAEVEKTAKASATALLGKGGIPQNAGDPSHAQPKKDETPEDFITAALAEKKAPHRAGAIALMAREKKELYAVHIGRA